MSTKDLTEYQKGLQAENVRVVAAAMEKLGIIPKRPVEIALAEVCEQCGGTIWLGTCRICGRDA